MDQELEFLSEIDKYRYNKYYYLPGILASLSITKSDLKHLKEGGHLPEISKFMSNWVVGVIQEGFEMRSFFPGNKFFSWKVTIVNIHNIFRTLEISIQRLGQKIKELKSYKENSDGTVSLSVGELIKLGTADEFSLLISQIAQELFNKAWEIVQSTKDEENSSLLDGLV